MGLSEIRKFGTELSCFSAISILEKKYRILLTNKLNDDFASVQFMTWLWFRNVLLAYQKNPIRKLVMMLVMVLENLICDSYFIHQKRIWRYFQRKL